MDRKVGSWWWTRPAGSGTVQFEPAQWLGENVGWLPSNRNRCRDEDQEVWGPCVGPLDLAKSCQGMNKALDDMRQAMSLIRMSIKALSEDEK